MDTITTSVESFFDPFLKQLYEAHEEVIQAIWPFPVHSSSSSSSEDGTALSPSTTISDMIEDFFSGPGVFAGVRRFVEAVDWFGEPFFLYLAIFHVVFFLFLAFFTYNSVNRTAVALAALLVIGLSLSHLNEWGRENYEWLFPVGKVNYFDPNGIFVSALLGAPIVLYALVLQIKLMVTTFGLLVRVKRAEIRSRVNNDKNENNKNNKDTSEPKPETKSTTSTSAETATMKKKGGDNNGNSKKKTTTKK